MKDYDSYPYAGFHPGDSDGKGLMKAIFGGVSLILLAGLLFLAGCTETTETKEPIVVSPPTKAELTERPGCVSVPMVEAKMAEPDSDFAGEDHAHLEGDRAEALAMKVLGQPLPVSDVLVYPMPDGMRVLFFNQGCLVHFEDVAAPSKTKSQSL